MAYVIANIGTSQNVPVWDIRCDSTADLDKLNVKKIPTGSTAYMIETSELYMLNSLKEWKLQ